MGTRSRLECWKDASYKATTLPADAQKEKCLVHGTVRGSPGGDLRVAHAWVEHGELVWEPQGDEWWPHGVWENMAEAITYASYTVQEAAGMIVERRSFGPWDKDLIGLSDCAFPAAAERRFRETFRVEDEE